MFADWVRMTSSTGGTGALTLTAVTGWPRWQDVWGSTGSRYASYCIQEWAGTDHSGPPIKAEGGLGTINLATGVLTRSKPASTWLASGPTYDGTSPSAISFGTTAANIEISSSPLADFSPDTIPYLVSAAPGEPLGGMSSQHAMVSNSNRTFTANTGYFTAFLWLGLGEIIQISMYVETAVASSGCKAAIFECGTNGLPGNRLLDINSASPYNTTTIGAKATAVTAGFYLPQGWYYSGLVSGHAIVVRCADPQTLLSMTGCASTGGPNTHLSASVTYTTGFAATAPATFTAGGTANGPVVFMKMRN